MADTRHVNSDRPTDRLSQRPTYLACLEPAPVPALEHAEGHTAGGAVAAAAATAAGLLLVLLLGLLLMGGFVWHGKNWMGRYAITHP